MRVRVECVNSAGLLTAPPVHQRRIVRPVQVGNYSTHPQVARFNAYFRVRQAIKDR